MVQSGVKDTKIAKIKSVKRDFDFEKKQHKLGKAGASLVRENKQEPMATEAVNVNECCVCLENVKNTALVPCHHMCICGSCADDLMLNVKPLCPLCRTEVRKIIKLFL
jgi:hypothetical protein